MPSSLQCPNCSSRAPEFRHSLFKLGEPSVLFAFKEGHQHCLLLTVLDSQPICATMTLPMTCSVKEGVRASKDAKGASLDICFFAHATIFEAEDLPPGNAEEQIGRL
ncbi:hypothetical protein SUGI_0861520 [Cryptomeria japonica]|nr:hypothetical protein SUGI_0861520 [Cryptomeria japonica]